MSNKDIKTPRVSIYWREWLWGSTNYLWYAYWFDGRHGGEIRIAKANHYDI